MKWILETLTPLQVGSGENLFPDLDFVYLEGMPFVVDQKATFDALAVSDISLNNLGELPTIVDDVHRQFGEYFGYALTSLSTPPVAKKEIREHIKDAFARPFIPGSSLKGAIRTALFAEYLRKTPKEKLKKNLPFKKDVKPSVGPKVAAQNLTRSIFSPDAPRKKEPNYDWMRLWKIGDLRFSQNDLCLADVRFLNITKEELQWKDIPSRKNFNDWEKTQGILTETLQPGAATIFDVSFDKFLLDDPQAKSELKWRDVPRDFNELRKILNAHSLFRIRVEGEFYHKHGAATSEIYADLLQKMNKDPDAIFLQLGWGSGWRGMTGDWMDEPTEKEMRGLYRLRQNNPIFPKTRRLALDKNGPVLPFGWVMIRDADEYPDLREKTETSFSNEAQRIMENQQRIQKLIAEHQLHAEQARSQKDEEQKQADAEAQKQRLEAEKQQQYLESLSPLERLMEELKEDQNYKEHFGRVDEFEGEDKRFLAEFFKKRFVEENQWNVKENKAPKQFKKVQKLKQILS